MCFCAKEQATRPKIFSFPEKKRPWGLRHNKERTAIRRMTEPTHPLEIVTGWRRWRFNLFFLKENE
jgi:hypothetical protein